MPDPKAPRALQLRTRTQVLACIAAVSLFTLSACQEQAPAPPQADQGAAKPGRAPDILLKDFQPKPMVMTSHHVPAKSKFPVIDNHNHLGGMKGRAPLDPAKCVQIMDETGVAQVVNLDGGWGEDLKATIERFEKAYPGRFLTYARVDWSKVEDGDFGQKAAAQLEADVKAGAHGLKIAKSDIGLTRKYSDGRVVPVDDPRFDPIWAKCAELKIPVEVHVGDPAAFFTPLDRFNERYEELQDHVDWLFYPGFPPLETIVAQFMNVVARHPKTTFIGAHFGCYAENMEWVAQQLDKYPNLYIDIDARIHEIGRRPYTARKMLIKYQDRILFGTDTRPDAEAYRVYFQFLETEDEYIDVSKSHHLQGRWKVNGMYLPDEVLEKIYYKNAVKLIPGAKVKS